MRADPILLLAACGCVGGVSYVELPQPDASIRSVIVVKEGDGFSLSAYRAEHAPAAISVSDEILIVTVLHYREPLEELGLPAGELTIAEGGVCASLPLPEPGAILQGGERGFQPAAVLTDAIASLRIEVACPCVELEISAFDLPDVDSVRSAIPYDEQRIMLVTDEGITLVDASARTEQVAVPAPFWAAFEDQQGTFWFGDVMGQLWFGDPLGELRRTYTSSAALEMVRVGGYVEAGRFELLAVSKDRLLQRFDGERWEVLFSQGDLSNDQDGELIFLRPGRAVATLPNGNGMIQYDASSVIPVELDEWEPARRGHLVALEQIDPLGTFIGTRTGRKFLRKTEDGLLEELEDPIPIEERLAAYDLIPFRGGFIEVGRRGFVRQWHPASGYCEGTNVDFQVDLLRIAALDEVFVAGGLSRDPINKGFVIRVQP